MLFCRAGQHKGETCLKRCAVNAEINTDVEVGTCCVRDYISNHHEFAEANGHVHELSFSFLQLTGVQPQAGEDLTQVKLGELDPLDQRKR